MNMSVSNSLDSVVPADFPREVYNRIGLRIYEKLYLTGVSPVLAEHFSDAWLAVAYRFFACTEHDASFRSSIERAGSNPPRLEHYIQERELYGFFVTGLTVIESFYYGCYVIASMINGDGFPMDNPRSIQVSSTADKFVKNFAQKPITRELDSLRNNDAFKRWSLIRNVLAHRVNPARQVTVTLWPPKENPLHEVSWPEEAITIDRDTTASRRTWLANNITRLIAELDTFTHSNFG